MITLHTNTSPNPTFLTWFRLEKLIENFLMNSIEPTVAPIAAAANSVILALDTLHTAYENISQTLVCLITLLVSLKNLAPLMIIFTLFGLFRMC